jgi:uncharacterized membrane protein
VNDRVRSVLLGLAVGLVPLLLLDLADTLRGAAQRDSSATNLWWMLACFVLAGVIVAAGVAASRRDRIVPAVALVVAAVVTLVAMPTPGLGWLTQLPLVGALATNYAVVAVGGVMSGAYAFALMRGPRS